MQASSLKLHQHLPSNNGTIKHWKSDLLNHHNLHLLPKPYCKEKYSYIFNDLNRFSPKSSYSLWGHPSHFCSMVFNGFHPLTFFMCHPIASHHTQNKIQIYYHWFLIPLLSGTYWLSTITTLYPLLSLCFNHTRIVSVPQICRTLQHLGIFSLMFCA